MSVPAFGRRDVLATSLAAFLVAAAAPTYSGAKSTTDSDAEDPMAGVRRAVAMYKVNALPLRLLEPQEFSEREYDLFRKTQVAYIRSPFVLNAALRERDVAALPLIKNRDKPMEWLSEALVVSYPCDGELLQIVLPHEDAPADDLEAVVEAVSKAYWEEVVYRDRSIAAKPLEILRKSYAKLQDQVDRKLRVLHSLQRDLESVGSDPTLTPMLLEEHRALYAEKLRTERELAGLDGEKADALRSWATLVHEYLEEVRESARRASQPNADLETRREELKQLQRFADRVGEKIQVLQIELQAPQRILPVGISRSGAATAEFFEAGEEKSGGY